MKPKQFTNSEAVQLMNQCIGEITMLRAEIGRLAPKAEAYDVLCKVVDMIPDIRPRSASVDLVWSLQCRIEDIEAPEPND